MKYLSALSRFPFFFLIVLAAYYQKIVPPLVVIVSLLCGSYGPVSNLGKSILHTHAHLA